MITQSKNLFLSGPIIILYHKFDIINLARISHGIDTLGDNVMEQVLVPVLRKRIKRKKMIFNEFKMLQEKNWVIISFAR